MKKECNSARRQLVNNLADELKTSNSPKPFWNLVQSKRKVKCDLVSLKVNDSYLNDDLSIANCIPTSIILPTRNYVISFVLPLKLTN